MLIICGLVLAGLIVMIAAYRFIRLWLTWMDSKALEEQQVRDEGNNPLPVPDQVSICSRCQTELDNETRFCPECGTQVSQQ